MQCGAQNFKLLIHYQSDKKNPASAGFFLSIIYYRFVIGLYFGTSAFITTHAIK